jgi:hypothetical protein
MLYPLKPTDLLISLYGYFLVFTNNGIINVQRINTIDAILGSYAFHWTKGSPLP